MKTLVQVIKIVFVGLLSGLPGLVFADPPYPSADTIDQTIEQITEPYMEGVLNDVDGLTSTVEAELKDGGGWEPGTLGLFSYGMIDPINTTLFLDHIWNSGIPQTFGAIGLLDPDLPGQTVRCNASDFPYTHFHTYHALHTPAIRQCGWPGQDWFTGGGVPGNPANPQCTGWWCPGGSGVNEQFPEATEYGEQLFGEFQSFMETLSPLLGLLGGGCSCCFIPCPWGCCVRHRCVHNTSYKPWQYNELGFPAGICIEAKNGFLNGELTCCPLRIEFANVVDYMYPTNQISISRQPYASRRLDLFENLEQNVKYLQYIVQNWLHDPDMQGNRGVQDQAIRQLVEISKSAQQNGTLGDFSPLSDPTKPASYELAKALNILGGAYADWSAFENADPETALFMAFALPKADTDQGYFRIMDNEWVTEEIHGGNPGRRNRPPHFIMYHQDEDGNSVRGQPFLNSDYFHKRAQGKQWGMKLAMWMDQSRKHNEPFYDSGSEVDLIGQPEICAKVNAQRGAKHHTPGELLDLLSSGSSPLNWGDPITTSVKDRFDGNFHNYRCIRNVGEAFPHTASVRPSNNALIFQSLIRGMDQYERKYQPKSERYSSEWDKDRFSMLSGDRYDLVQYAGPILGDILGIVGDLNGGILPEGLKFPTKTNGDINLK
ncbi:MAG: hypothetical protein KDD64_16465, partial [Bdellovibrionales bacterium]|nr:hypothetical protein [Bdellovibrionales bacterium]